ncbi:MAG: 2-carboxy-1,4-naphthoquinone phytyltransferase [Almyronema sp.]
MTTQTVQPSQKKLWLAAIKPPMYSVAVMPICVGTAVAFFETQVFHAGIFFIFVLSAILILAWENLSNDVFDSDTGIDVNKAHSVVNLTRSRSLVFWLSNFVLALGITGILAIALWQRDFTVLGLILLCCLLGYVYQGPPFRWGYQGLGEVLCFFSFGPLGVGAAYYSQAQTWSITGLAAAVIIGLTTSLVLFCSHFHQVEDDLAAGKRSPIVRLGTWRGALLLPWIGGSVFAIAIAFVILDFFPVWTLLVLASLPPVVRLCQHVRCYHAQPAQVHNAKFVAIAFHFWSGVLLCLGFLIPHVLPL